MSHMEQFPSFPVLTVFLLFLFVLIKFGKKPKVLTDKLPSGPPKLPLIGNLHQLIIGSSSPHRALANLAKKYGPVMHLQLGQHFAIIISSSEAAKEVLEANDLNFSQRPKVLAFELMNPDENSGFTFAPYGDYWRHIRKVCAMELLSMNCVQSFKSIREEEARDLIESICSQEGVPINLSDKIFTMINNVTSRAAFGKKYCKDQGEFMSVMGEAAEVVAGFNMADLFPLFKFLHYITGLRPKIKKLQRKMDKIFDDILKEHKVKSKSTVSIYEDLLDVLLRLQDLGDMQLTTDHIKSMVREIFLTGTDTAATTIEWAMSELIKNPRVMENAQIELRQVFRGKTKIEEADIQNVDCLKLIIKETLRLHPVGPLLPRESMEKCEIGGYQIPAKTKILINAWAIGRDPTIWTEPDYFKPERFEDSPIDFRGLNFGFIPFGAGRRICPGISFANANMELALAQLLYHFDWKVPSGIKPEELDMSETFGATVGRKHKLHLIATTSIPFRV